MKKGVEVWGNWKLARADLRSIPDLDSILGILLSKEFQKLKENAPRLFKPMNCPEFCWDFSK